MIKSIGPLNKNIPIEPKSTHSSKSALPHPSGFQLPEAPTKASIHKTTLPTFEMIQTAEERMKNPLFATIDVFVRETMPQGLPFKLNDKSQKVLTEQVIKCLVSALSAFRTSID